MRMRAIADHHGPGAAAVQAVRAGVDVVLALGEGAMQQDAITALQAAAGTGEIPAAQLQAAAARVGAAKERLGLLASALVREDEVTGRVDEAGIQALAARVAESAATLVMDPLGTIPLPRGPVLVATGAAAPTTAERLATALRDRGRTVTVRAIDATGSADGSIVVPVGEEAAALDRSLGPLPPSEQVAAVTQRARGRGRVVVVATSIPYLLAHAVPGCAGLAVYGADDASLQAAARVLTGEITPRGRLPVTVAGGRP
jgi:beta-N-acetylhexosaminidase